MYLINGVWGGIGMSMTQQAQTQFQLQMEEWLDFAWANRNNPDFKTPQTPRWVSKRESGATSPLGSQASQIKTNVPTGTKSKNIINTHALYRAWKAQSTVIKKSSRKNCFLHYTEAIPEMHIFFDFMSDVQSVLGYDGFDDLFDSHLSTSTRPKPLQPIRNHNQFRETHLDGESFLPTGNRFQNTTPIVLQKGILDMRCYCASNQGKVLSWRWGWVGSERMQLAICLNCNNYHC